MKQFKIRDLLTYVLSVVLVSLILHIAFMFLSLWFSVPQISLGYILIVGLFGLFINFYEPSWLEEDTKKWVIIGIGIATSLALAFVLNRPFNIVGFAATFIFFLIIWNRAIKNSYADIEYLYGIEQFYGNVILMLLINVYTIYSKHGADIAAYITQYTVLYVIIAMFLIFEMKRLKFLKNTEKKRHYSEIIFMVGMILCTFVLSNAKALKSVSSIFRYIISLISPIFEKILRVIMWPIGKLVEVLANWIKGLLDRGFRMFAEKTNDSPLNKIANQMNELTDTDKYNPEITKWIVRILSTIIFIVILIVCIYFIYVYIDRLTRKRRKGEFYEDTEFVGNIKVNNIGSIIGNAAGKLSKAYKRATFSITADNREKLRHEYKNFLGKIYNMKLIDEVNCTARDVYDSLNSRFPNIDQSMEYITLLYEDVRYGTKMPENTELKQFKIKINEVVRTVG